MVEVSFVFSCKLPLSSHAIWEMSLAGQESRVESSLEISSLELRWASALSWWFSLPLGSREWKISSSQWFAQYSFPKDGLVAKVMSFVLTFVLSKCTVMCYKAHNLQPALKVNTIKRGRWCPPNWVKYLLWRTGLFHPLEKKLLFVALGLLCCTRAFPSCGEQALLFAAVHRPLVAVVSLVVEHSLQGVQASGIAAYWL